MDPTPAFNPPPPIMNHRRQNSGNFAMNGSKAGASNGFHIQNSISHREQIFETDVHNQNLIPNPSHHVVNNVNNFNGASTAAVSNQIDFVPFEELTTNEIPISMEKNCYVEFDSSEMLAGREIQHEFDRNRVLKYPAKY